jgi:hypothetical protein
MRVTYRGRILLPEDNGTLNLTIEEFKERYLSFIEFQSTPNYSRDDSLMAPVKAIMELAKQRRRLFKTSEQQMSDYQNKLGKYNVV